MSIVIGRLEFDGPFSDPAQLRAEPGIYGIVCQIGDDFELLDLDETHCVSDCLDFSEHTNNLLFYAETSNGKLSAIVHYTPDLTQGERAELKYDLMAELDADTLEVQPPIAV